MAKNGLSRAQVEHIAKLALLPLTVKETPIFQEQLSEVVEYVQKISNIPGLAKRSGAGKYQISKIKKRETTEKKKVGRKDGADVARCLSQEDALSGTKNKHNGLFVTPAIFEES